MRIFCRKGNVPIALFNSKKLTKKLNISLTYIAIIKPVIPKNW